MHTIGTHGTFEQAVAGATLEMRQLAIQLRAVILDVYPQAYEVPWPKQQIVGYGVGPKKMTEHFCYIGLHRKHVNLGFYYGAHLSDPDGLMEGSGQKMRHVKVNQADKVAAPGIRRLIEQAVEERQRTLEPRP